MDDDVWVGKKLSENFYLNSTYYPVQANEVAQSCPTLCNPMGCNIPGSSVHGILQARILEWVAISFSRGSSRPRDRTQVSCIIGRCFTIWATGKPHFAKCSIYSILSFYTVHEFSQQVYSGGLPFSPPVDVLLEHSTMTCLGWPYIAWLTASLSYAAPSPQQGSDLWRDFLFLGSKITVDGDCNYEIRRWLLFGRNAMTNLDSVLKSRDITLSTKVCMVKTMVFPEVIYGCESWTVKKAECQRTDAFEL